MRFPSLATAKAATATLALVGAVGALSWADSAQAGAAPGASWVLGTAPGGVGPASIHLDDGTNWLHFTGGSATADAWIAVVPETGGDRFELTASPNAVAIWVPATSADPHFPNYTSYASATHVRHIELQSTVVPVWLTGLAFHDDGAMWITAPGDTDGGIWVVSSVSGTIRTIDVYVSTSVTNTFQQIAPGQPGAPGGSLYPSGNMLGELPVH